MRGDNTARRTSRPFGNGPYATRHNDPDQPAVGAPSVGSTLLATSSARAPDSAVARGCHFIGAPTTRPKAHRVNDVESPTMTAPERRLVTDCGVEAAGASGFRTRAGRRLRRQPGHRITTSLSSTPRSSDVVRAPQAIDPRRAGRGHRA